jgi:hypothetical protein
MASGYPIGIENINIIYVYIYIYSILFQYISIILKYQPSWDILSNILGISLIMYITYVYIIEHYISINIHS